ncbi:LEM-3-like GIY-YIG domain-containing protein [Butyricicoccus sp.]|uniref:LEM-3-like GIY-YIG domain-containing protein n=1 Tax=Butyricicoccus sp. TaxID=2049021 RepID=UPI003F16BFC1
MMTSFSQNTIEKLGYYVYVYSDPDTHKPFYVGKGKGNRVFDHLFYQDDSEKVAYIQRLIQGGKEPLIEILVHGVDEETALKVEAAAIDLIGIENLTNRQRGYHSAEYGKIEVSLLESRYNCEQIKLEDFNENAVLIRINQLYRNDMTVYELYETTRGFWRINPEQIKKVKYALAVYYGMVLEVYEIAAWFPAFSTMTQRYIPDTEQCRNRYEFVGNIAPESVRKKFRDKSVASLFPQGAQNPIRYIIADEGNAQETYAEDKM